jgi:hypothetical protein
MPVCNPASIQTSVSVGHQELGHTQPMATMHKHRSHQAQETSHMYCRYKLLPSRVPHIAHNSFTSKTFTKFTHNSTQTCSAIGEAVQSDLGCATHSTRQELALWPRVLIRAHLTRPRTINIRYRRHNRLRSLPLRLRRLHRRRLPPLRRLRWLARRGRPLLLLLPRCAAPAGELCCFLWCRPGIIRQPPYCCCCCCCW